MKGQDVMFKQLLEQHNPFGVKNVDGSAPSFTEPYRAYYDILLKIWSVAPRGFIDIPYILCRFAGLPVNDGARLCKRQEIHLVELWNPDDPQRKDQLRVVLQKMLCHTGCDFDENAFLMALYQFDKDLVIGNLIARTEDGEIVNFAKEYGTD